MGDNPDRKSGRVPCRKCGLDRLHRNGQTPTVGVGVLPARQVAGGMNLLLSFPLNCGQRFSVLQRSFWAQQRLGGLLALWMGKRLRSIGGRPLMMMMTMMMIMSVCFSCTHISRPLDLQGVVCARGAGVPGYLGDRLIRLLRPSSGFRALGTGAISISLGARVLLK